MVEQLKMLPADTQEEVTFTRMVEVTDSQVISRIAYAPTKRVLRVWFLSTGTVWQFEEVWPGDFAALVSSYSIGSTFNERIRDRFPAKRIKEVVDKTLPVKKQPLHQHPPG